MSSGSLTAAAFPGKVAKTKLTKAPTICLMSDPMANRIEQNLADIERLKAQLAEAKLRRAKAKRKREKKPEGAGDRGMKREKVPESMPTAAVKEQIIQGGAASSIEFPPPTADTADDHIDAEGSNPRVDSHPLKQGAEERGSVPALQTSDLAQTEIEVLGQTPPVDIKECMRAAEKETEERKCQRCLYLGCKCIFEMRVSLQVYDVIS